MGFNSELAAGRGTLPAATEPNKERNQEISANEYARFRNFLEKHSGIMLGEGKEYLVKNRLRNVLNDCREDTFADLINVLEKGTHSALYTSVIDAMTTNETLWFRDKYPFEILIHTLLPELAENQNRPIKIWSAASSTGQEAYSICITINEYLSKKPGGLPHGYDVVGTDISETALKQAREGSYDSYDVVRGLTGHHQDKYFSKDGEHQVICDAIKQQVRFQQSNLLESYTLLGQFDIIFCRNVLIYFSNKVKADILSRMAKSLRPGGYLFLGGPEMITSYTEQFEMIRGQQGVVYRLKD